MSELICVPAWAVYGALPALWLLSVVLIRSAALRRGRAEGRIEGLGYRP